MKRHAFSMLELTFVIVVMGILAKFGTDLFLKSYEGYARTILFNELQTKSAAAIQSIANRLRYRIKDSISSGDIGGGSVTWVGYDAIGWQNGSWSGVIDVNAPATTKSSFVSPGTTGCMDEDGAATNDCALFMLGGDVNVAGSNIYYPVTVGGNTITPSTAFAAGDDLYEFYQLANSQYKLQLNGSVLSLTHDMQPWAAGGGNAGTTDVFCDEVSQFEVAKEGDGVNIRLCLSRNILGEGAYEICKSMFIF